MRRFGLVASAALLLACAIFLLAQTPTPSVEGSVKDPSGALIAGVTVQVLDAAGKVVAETQSDATGKFRFGPLAPGSYKLKATAQGFRSSQVVITIRKGETVRFDFTLDVGSVAETVELSDARQNSPIQRNRRMHPGLPAGTAGGVIGGIIGGVPGGSGGAGAAPPPPGSMARYRPIEPRENYAHIDENRFQSPVTTPLSTFSIDVDTASYANMRRFLRDGMLPPKDAVRTEELVNYFSYSYPEPAGEHPVSITTEVASCPWQPKHKLARIGLKAKSIDVASLPPANLVFLLDVSGSMASQDKLPLLQRAFALLAEQLRPQDEVAIVVYAGSAGTVLPPTSGSERAKILEAVQRLYAGGSTAGAQGIQLAYKTARDNFKKNGNNRVILATDGDFNVGVSTQAELIRLIEEERKAGVFLTVLGFGTGNLQDAKMEALAKHGNGNYAYVDSLLEARKVLVQEMGANLLTLAKDVKLQIEFNPARVKAYRLIGYENRLLAAEDFNDDKKDAGEMGAGHTVTALYEIVPPGVEGPEVEGTVPAVDALKYQKAQPAAGGNSAELLTVKLRYKQPTGDRSQLLSVPLPDASRSIDSASEDLRFAAAVAEFAHLLRESQHKGNASFDQVVDLAGKSLGRDPHGHRAEFLYLVKTARGMPKTE
jgi:Ca-activated chloride channel family protein